MRNKLIPVDLRVWTLGPAAGAQRNLSGNKPDAQYAIELADRPNHSLTMAKFTCTWSRPMETAGIEGKEGYSVVPGEGGGTKLLAAATLWAAGPTRPSSARYQGTDIRKDSPPQSSMGTPSFTGGTGRLKGLRGRAPTKAQQLPIAA
jgi:hypothetical protein